jgi:hypothetical protein
MLHIADDVFGPISDEWGDYASHESIKVSGTDTDAIVVALTRAGERFFLVAETGFEFATFDEMVDAGDEFYTPNYVSDPVIEAAGVGLYVDCKGEIRPGMRNRFVHILREELGHLEARVEVSA